MSLPLRPLDESGFGAVVDCNLAPQLARALQQHRLLIVPRRQRETQPGRPSRAGFALQPHGPVRSRDHVAGKRIGRVNARACSLQWTATPPEEVRPMNAVSMWVLPLPVTVGRLT
ncbi:hypothetical protein SM007_28310 [Streptomyces avermitilis]|uniref:Uncharacterized protein n=1 Tax=Streptomyces avermitilis TaxID=33903 RepID=A0A4D4MFE8_STRAX|nr:hypothetical protein SM007_28310 [Streptomyces avermitilis]GDY68905.1 hypothetical protein SAV14893_082980 [Streptomyces avermitilis]GDY70711.1 hypothetical protein SAV31267_001960 [Streptomyces avermitilis]